MQKFDDYEDMGEDHVVDMYDTSPYDDSVAGVAGSTPMDHSNNSDNINTGSSTSSSGEGKSLLPSPLPAHYTIYHHEETIEPRGTTPGEGGASMTLRRKKVRKSSDTQAFLNIIKAFVGSGILGMPFAFKNAGTVLGGVVLCVLGVIAIYCTFMLVKNKMELQRLYPKKRIYTYGDVGHYSLGKAGAVLVELMLIFTQTGFCIAYLIFIGSNMASLVKNLGGWVFVCISAAILLPIIFFRTMRYLSPFSILSEVAIFVGMGIVYYYDIFNMESAENFLRADMANPWNLPIFFGISVYSFEGIGIALPVHGNMKKPDHFRRVVLAALLLYGFLLLTFGILGYVAFLDDTKDAVTLNLPDNLLSLIVKVGLIIGLLFTYPLQLFPVTEMFDAHTTTLTNKIFKNHPVGKQRYQKYFRLHVENLYRVVLLVMTVLLSILGSDFFGLILSLIGGIGGSSLAFTFPALIHVRLFWRKMPWYRTLLDLVIVFVGVAGGITTATMSIQSIVSELTSQ